MDELTLTLVSITFFGLIIGGIFLLVHRSQTKNEQGIIQFASENGWIYESIREPLIWGLSLKSAQWTLEAVSRSSGSDTEPDMTTTWHAKIPGSTLLIGPRSSQMDAGRFGNVLIHQVFQLALGAEADGLTEVQTGSKTFRQKYMLWARNPAEVTGLLTADFESTLLNWKGTPPLIKRTSHGLEIKIRGARLKKMEEIRALTSIGNMLIAHLQTNGDNK